ncbi:MAG: type IV pilus biogenesis protein PilC [Phycisphaeraceae bacterium]|nr:MAG: type IV pilus biogenesis protein PilC [Phycisphaeraceae bacterium]
MPTFEYIAVNGEGGRVAGALAGATPDAITAELQSRRLTPVSIREQKRRADARRGVRARRLGASYQQLADLLGAGVPLMRTLELLARAGGSPRLSAVYRELAQEVSEGADLADAMEARAGFFPPVHVAMVRAGERGAFLEQVFERLAQFVTRQADLRGRVTGALVYPAFLIGLGSIILAVLFTFFVPQFRGEFAKLDHLPLITHVVLGVADAFTSYGLVTFSILALLIGAVWWWARQEESRRAMNRWATRAPLIGPLVRALATARFCRMLGTMESNGVPLLNALTIARGAAGNVLLEEAIAEATEAVRAGKTLAEPLGRSVLFDDDVAEMIGVGEAAGNIDHVLLRTADTIEARVDRLLATLIRLMEPCLLVVLAIVIGSVAMGLILPLMHLGDAVR